MILIACKSNSHKLPNKRIYQCNEFIKGNCYTVFDYVYKTGEKITCVSYAGTTKCRIANNE